VIEEPENRGALIIAAAIDRLIEQVKKNHDSHMDTLFDLLAELKPEIEELTKAIKDR
jgi:spermidine/putrescine-binding protein